MSHTDWAAVVLLALTLLSLVAALILTDVLVKKQKGLYDEDVEPVLDTMVIYTVLTIGLVLFSMTALPIMVRQLTIVVGLAILIYGVRKAFLKLRKVSLQRQREQDEYEHRLHS